MRILVTRPQPEADETAARLVARGHQVLIDPILHYVALPPPAPIDRPAAIIFTSRNGVRALASWPQKAAWGSVPVFVVGAGTAKAAREAGFTDVRSGNGDAVALALLVVVSLDADAGPIVYPGAEERGPVLETQLKAAGFAVNGTSAYRMDASSSFLPAAIEALRARDLDGVVLYSSRTAATFRELARNAGLEDALADLRAYTLSESVAVPLAGLALREVLVAERPNESSLLSLITPPG